MMMSNYRAARKAERDIGLEYFFTSDDGIGGRLRTTAEDFIVMERSDTPEPDDEGELTAAIITSKNWETNRLVRQFARYLRISRKKVMFAGTKDKRAITTQLFVFDAPLDYVQHINLADIVVEEAYSTKHPIGIGDLNGNNFIIAIRELECGMDEAESACESIACQIRDLDGFPNFFGVQRFGAARANTHIMGRHMTREEPEKAVWEYLCQVGEEPEDVTKARKDLDESQDYKTALKEFPKTLSFEKAIMNHLVNHPEDHVGALGQLPHNLLMMFVHAYQSYIFNRIISERMRSGLPLKEPVEGDLVLKVDRFGLPSHDQWVLALDRNLAKLTELVGKGKAFVSAPLYGTDTELAEGEPGEIERRVIEKEGADPKDFILSEYHRLRSKGTRREIVAPLKGLEFSVGDDAIVFKFELTKGCYATTLLREFMKCEKLTRY